jgi:hypothetical protein
MSLLTFIQFINPSANWYSLFVVCIIIFFIHTQKRFTPIALILLGLLLGLLFCIRQPSAIFAGMGILGYLIYLHRLPEIDNRLSVYSTIIGQILIGSMITVVAIYLLTKTGFFVTVFWGLPIIGILYLQLRSTKIMNPTILRIIFYLSLGVVISIIPLVIYHLVNDSIIEWLNDSIFAAIGLTELPFMKSRHYEDMLAHSILNLFSFDFQLTLNGFFWIFLLLNPTILGIWLIHSLRLKNYHIRSIAYLPMFFVLVSGHYEIPIYLLFTSALTLSAIASQIQTLQTPSKHLLNFGLLCLVFVGLIFHAGQPLSRGLIGTLDGKQIAQSTQCSLQNCELLIEKEMNQTYESVLHLIHKNTHAEETILAIPFNPEFYFLSDRQPPVRFYNTAFGLKDKKDVEITFQQLISSKTKIIIYTVDDKYNTPLSKMLMEKINIKYNLIETVDRFQIYQLKDR